MIALIDHRIDAQSISALKNQGFEPILMPPAHYLQTSVASHVDMLIFIGFGKMFCHKRYYDDNTELVSKIAALSKLELALSDEPTCADYPCDVLFNACIMGKKLICNKKTVSKLILDAAVEYGCEIVNVPQGYTKCSVCVVSDNAMITADKAIAEACRAKEFDVLTVCEGHVSLPPYNFGFIGGASGLCGNKVYFCGDIDRHPDADRIKEFCKKHGCGIVSLSSGELWDAGSLFFI